MSLIIKKTVKKNRIVRKLGFLVDLINQNTGLAVSLRTNNNHIMKYARPTLYLFAILLQQCQSQNHVEMASNRSSINTTIQADTIKPNKKNEESGTSKSAGNTPPPSVPLSDNSSKKNPAFQAVTALDPSIRLDIRYATTNNFTKAKIYDCPECLLRPAAAAAVVKAHKDLQKRGYGGLKMFDCYRPRPYQQRLWDKVPNPDYVTPPAKGSMHSRGAAVDLTIVDKNGNELDMGTPYDFFGKEAHYDYTKHSAKVLANRRLLRSVMESAGFKGIRTEWWHFSYRTGKYDLSSYVWKCP